MVSRSFIAAGLAAALLPVGTSAALAKVEWTTKAQFSAPESVFYDVESTQVFVSNVAGGAGEKDGKGWISTITVGKNGRPAVEKFVEGFDAPKGMRVRKGILYVTDIDQVVLVDVKAKAILKRVPVPGAVFLNDPAIGHDGTIYVSDTIASKIFAIKDGKVSEFANGDALASPNGLLVVGDRLYVASWGLITDPKTFGAKVPGHLYFIDLKTKAQVNVTKTPLGNLDGLERASNGDFIVSDWVAGKVFRVKADGAATVLAEGLHNAADLGIKGELLLVPEMGADQVAALTP